MKNTKILIVCNHIAIGGIAKSLLSLLKALYKEGVQVDVSALQVSDHEIKKELMVFAHFIEIPELQVIARNPRGIKKLFLLAKRRVLWETFALRFWNAKKTAGNDRAKRKRMFFNSKREYKLCKNSRVKIDLSNYDCVISWAELMTNYILAENIICKKKIGWVHPDYLNAGFSPEVDKKAFEKLDAIVAVSKSGEESLKKAFPDMQEKCFSVGNLLDLDGIRSASAIDTPEMGSNDFKIVTVARLQNRSKAFDRAVRICQKLRVSGRKFTWFIIGDGENKQDILNDINRLGVCDCVVLLGHKNNPYPYMKNADLFVLQSYYEGRPVSVDEAMALGTPVLVTDYASANEQIINNVNSFVVPNNEKDIFEKIAMIIDHPEILKNMRESLAKDAFSALTELSSFEKLIKGVMAR